MLVIFVTNFIVEIKKESNPQNVLGTLNYMLDHAMGSWVHFLDFAHILPYLTIHVLCKNKKLFFLVLPLHIS